ncbi:ABC transporter permease [Mesorhizobium australicum]|uniref:Monosaccharide ABC transporter membrane protein, CUT2 family n=1 Tax=Mesorhizobium australicum TaxID=536018 RepID=A0A1X7N290_9HYPH|nr:ABC transporter permease [Mesorhizobium australicum]SMH30868.1 monosaccharide ABC transporter membrane protein, CUT2 family [Mesorhizobium australicum]
MRLERISQEHVVAAIAVVLFVSFALTLPGFTSVGNIVSLIQSVSILGILGVGMAISIIGRGIDLSMVSIMVMSVGWAFQLVNGGMPVTSSVLLAIGFILLVGIANGILIAYVEIPAIFATLAMGTVVYGVGRTWMVDLDVVYLPAQGGWLWALGQGRLFGIPAPVIVFGVVSAVVYLFLRYTKWGRFLYGAGDNPLAARITGLPTRPLIVLQYVMTASLAMIAGFVMATAVSSMNTRVALSTLVYDVILVVVLGGVGLAGGKGGVRNVIVGTLLIGVLLNGMTIMNLGYTAQNMFKSLILLAAIVIDQILNPRDEQTAQSGDI